MNCPCCGGANTQPYNCQAAVTHWCRDCSCEWDESSRTASRAAMGEVWKAVEDELPPLDTPVWLHLKGGSIMQGERNDDADGWLWANSYNSAYVDTDGKWKSEPEMDDDYEVTHWMNLPEPHIAAGKGE